MPKNTVVKYDMRGGSVLFTAENAASAVAEALGSSVTTTKDGDNTTFHISLSQVGYPDLEFRLIDVPNVFGKHSIATDLYNTKGTIEQLRRVVWEITGSGQTPWNNAACCYIVRDSNNDTVIVGLHPGKTETAENDGGSVALSGAYICFFAGRDVNGEILWGSGNNHISQLTNGFKRLSFDRVSARPIRFASLSSINGPSDLFHFVKMRNYLSEGYPEMKTAYVALTRSDVVDDINKARSNLTYYSNGYLWGYGGTNYASVYDNTAECRDVCYAPIDPWVRF